VGLLEFGQRLSNLGGGVLFEAGVGVSQSLKAFLLIGDVLEAQLAEGLDER
jgi:hypothetical protein